jgi:hypothetical protein
MIEVAMKGRDGRSEIEIKRRGLRRWKKRLIYLKEDNGSFSFEIFSVRTLPNLAATT